MSGVGAGAGDSAGLSITDCMPKATVRDVTYFTNSVGGKPTMVNGWKLVCRFQKPGEKR